MPPFLQKLKAPGAPLTVIVLIALLLAGVALFGGQPKNSSSGLGDIVLVIPDDVSEGDPTYASWLDALREEGYPFSKLSASELIRASAAGSLKAHGLIMPDTFHRRAGVALIDALRHEVLRGSNLLLVFDAAIASPTGFINSPMKLRRLAGVDYALYEDEGRSATAVGPLTMQSAVSTLLHLPPGRMKSLPGSELNAQLQATAYGYEKAEFSHFVTRKNTSGTALVRSGENVLANLNQVGQGLVLFVNLPLGYLKSRTDGLWLHSFLRYFGDEIVRSPRLLASPDAVGGLIINWHVDDRKALGFLPLLDEIGFGDWGPYSIHLTAGPDTDAVGDGMGMDLKNNPEMIAWVRRMAQRGNSFGSHGGWIHNVFSLEVGERTRKQHEHLIYDNIRAVNDAVGSEIREYSAPSGNHPQWTTDLLKEMGIRAYYTTGNTGMGPTRSYQTADVNFRRAWSFPIAALDQAASFEEANDLAVPDARMLEWLNALTDYCMERRAVRLFYFHPIGVSMYKEVARDWLRASHALQSAGKIRLYTLAQMADFLDRRETVAIDLNPDTRNGVSTLRLGTPLDLAQQVLALPKSRFKRPTLLGGSGAVEESADSWLVRPGAGRNLEMRIEELNV